MSDNPIPKNQPPTGSLRSHEITQGTERVAHRALLFALGLKRPDFTRPLIAIVNSWNEVVPGCIHLRGVAEEVKAGVRAAGGVPLEFNTIAVCDGMAQGHVGMSYSLPSRDIIAASAEIMIQAHRFDGAVFIASCDKVTPGMLMAAARVNVPSIFVSAGTMAPGRFRGRNIALPNTRELAGAYQIGELTAEELAQCEEEACPGPGTCAMIGTANTMACLTEALGMSLPLSGTTPAVAPEKLVEARAAGERVVALVREGIRPTDIMTPAALGNALRVEMAISGSTNSVLHLPAIARELGIEISLDDFDQVSRETPYIASVNPSGPRTMDEFHAAGGVPAVLRSLFQAEPSSAGQGTLDAPRLASLIDGTARSVSGQSIGEIAAAAAWLDHDIIRPVDRPFKPDGGLAILHGSLAPEGAVVKKSAVAPAMLEHRGPAVVFESMEDAIAAVRENLVLEGSVIVIRNEGPVGGPGMREMQMITALMVGTRLAETTALVTDGRFSGSTRGPCVGHVSPEAAAGGPLALVQDGDTISLDIPARRIDLEVSDEELARRRAGWQPVRKEVPRGVLRLFARTAASVRQGAAME